MITEEGRARRVYRERQALWRILVSSVENGFIAVFRLEHAHACRVYSESTTCSRPDAVETRGMFETTMLFPCTHTHTHTHTLSTHAHKVEHRSALLLALSCASSRITRDSSLLYPSLSSSSSHFSLSSSSSHFYLHTRSSRARSTTMQA